MEGLEKYPDSGLFKIKLGWKYELEHNLGGAADLVPVKDILALALEGLADPNLPPAGHRFGL